MAPRLHPVTFTGLPKYERFATQLHQVSPDLVAPPVIAATAGQVASALCGASMVLLTGHGYSPTAWGDDPAWPWGDDRWFVGARNHGLGLTLTELVTAIRDAGSLAATVVMIDACEGGQPEVVGALRTVMQPGAMLVVGDGQVPWRAGERLIHDLIAAVGHGVPLARVIAQRRSVAPYRIA